MIFISKTDEGFGVTKSCKIRSLVGKRWLSLKVLNEMFEFMSKKLKFVENLPYITMEPCATESFNSNYLKEKLSEDTNILIIPTWKTLLVLNRFLLK